MLTTTSPGGISDVFMRALAEKLEPALGKSIVIENRPGGMQMVGARACEDAAPDGYTICIINADPMIYNQFLIKDMAFDPDKLQPITKLFDLLHALVVNSDLKVKNVDELVALSKAKPGTLSYVTPGAPMVLYMETLKKERGADWVRVPFKGGGEAVNAILSGSTPIGLFGEGNVIGQLRAGTMTELVMMNNIHSPNFPDDADAGRDRLSRSAVARLVRAVRADGHAAADHRPHRQGGRGHRRRSGLRAEAVEGQEPRRRDRYARRLRQADRRRSQSRRAGGQGRRHGAGIATLSCPRRRASSNRGPALFLRQRRRLLGRPPSRTTTSRWACG